MKRETTGERDLSKIRTKFGRFSLQREEGKSVT